MEYGSITTCSALDVGALSNMCFILHKWGLWTDVAKGTMVSGPHITGDWVRQERRCTRCGKLKLRTVAVKYG